MVQFRESWVAVGLAVKTLPRLQDGTGMPHAKSIPPAPTSPSDGVLCDATAVATIFVAVGGDPRRSGGRYVSWVGTGGCCCCDEGTGEVQLKFGRKLAVCWPQGFMHASSSGTNSKFEQDAKECLTDLDGWIFNQVNNKWRLHKIEVNQWRVFQTALSGRIHFARIRLWIPVPKRLA